MQFGALLAAIAWGPSFFYMVNIGIREGFRKAAMFALGIALSDTTMILIIFFGLGRVFVQPQFQKIFSVLSGVAVLIIGIIFLVKRQQVAQEKSIEIKSLPSIMYTVKGYTINLLNPFTILLWIAIIAKMVPEITGMNKVQVIEVFTSMIIIILTGDLLKCYFAKWLGGIINERSYQIVNKILGVIFIILSIRLFLHTYEILTHPEEITKGAMPF